MAPRLFQKGKSGNPGGRPKGLASLVRDKTSNGSELVDAMVKIMRDKGTRTGDRIEAIKWLADRGHGKAVDVAVTLDATPNQIAAVSELADVALEEMARGLADSHGAPILLPPRPDPEPVATSVATFEPDPHESAYPLEGLEE